MKICRICKAALGEPDFFADRPSITSISTLIDEPNLLFVCRSCGHIQSDELKNIKAFYESEYRISLQSEQHDQIYEVRDSVTIFRTAHQANTVLDMGIPNNAKVLDFGAAKAATLKAIYNARQDITPFVFDVSEDYRVYWNEWIPECRQATHELPADWRQNFDLITSHFVFEHVADPVSVLCGLRQLLATDGRLLFTVPDPYANSGDFLVVDHLNHFSTASLISLCSAAKLEPVLMSRELVRGAFLVVAKVSEEPVEHVCPKEEIAQGLSLLNFWTSIISKLNVSNNKSDIKNNFAIYGAGFYGALIASRLKHKPICFLDRNPFIQGSIQFGAPVFCPEDCPEEITHIYAGLNPAYAQEILKSSNDWIPKGAELVFFSDV